MMGQRLGSRLLAACLVVLAVCVAPVAADVKLPAIIGSNMVLQQGAKLPVSAFEGVFHQNPLCYQTNSV